MARVKRGLTKSKRHKKVLSMAKGYRGRSSTCYRIAHERVEKGLQYAYRDRRKNKSNFRTLWISRINAGVREYGITYSEFIFGLNKAGVLLDRKVLSEMATNDSSAFKTVVDTAKRFISGKENAPA